MSSERSKHLRKQIILITTGPPTSCQDLTEQSLKYHHKRFKEDEHIESRNIAVKNVKQSLIQKESTSSKLMCSICLNTRCLKCLKPTDSTDNHVDSCPGFVETPKCPKCYYTDSNENDSRKNKIDLKNPEIKKEMRDISTQDSRSDLLNKDSDTKDLQTSKTYLGNVDLLNLVMKLSECPCKKTCKNNKNAEVFCNHNSNVKIQKDHQCIRDHREETTKINEESKINSRTSNLVVSNVCQISFGRSIEDFYDNESRCTVVKISNSEQTNEKKHSDIFLKEKSCSVPQMKIEELKKSLKEKSKPKDTIEEVNRMFANVRKNDSDASELNRPSTRTGPRVLPVVKSPNYEELPDLKHKEETKEIKQRSRDEISLMNAKHCPHHHKGELKKCIYTQCCHHNHCDHEKVYQGDCKNQRTDSACHCRHKNRQATYNQSLGSNSGHTSSTFS